MTNTATCQFHVANMGQQLEAGSAVVRGDVLYYLVTGGDSQVKVDTCNVDDLRAGDVNSVTANEAWNSFELATRVPKSNGARFTSEFRPAAVLFGQTIYFFWVDSASDQVYAVSMDQAGALSSSPYKIFARGSSGTSPLQGQSYRSYLAADVAPNGADIILNWFDPSSTQLGSLVLDPKKIDEDSRQWLGTTGDPLQPSEHALGSVDKNYFRISTAWFTQGSEGNFMIASFYASTGSRAYFLLYPIKRDGTPAKTDSGHVFTINDLSAKRGFTVSRDPAGRIHGISCDDDAETNVVTRNFSTNQNVRRDESGKDPTLAWGEKSNLNGVSQGSEKAPVMAFVAGVPSAGSIIATVNGTTAPRSTTDIRYYGFAFYAKDHKNLNEAYDVQCQVAFYGTSSIVPEFQTITPNASYASKRLLSIVMDTFPFPDENLGGSVTKNQRIIEYTYGASTETEFDVTFSVQSLFGVRTTFTTTAGIGPASESEYRSGPQGNFGRTKVLTESTGYSVTTTPIDAPSGASTQFKIEAHGEYFATTPSMFVVAVALFKDTGGKAVSGYEAPLFSMITPMPGSDTVRVSGQYGTYCYTPGDIFSYGKERIDRTMAGLYASLSPEKKGLLSTGYATGYIDNVIIPNAYTFPNGKNFLEFTIGSSGGSGSTFQSISETLMTMGTLINSDDYFGFSGGTSISLFGFIDLFGVAGSRLTGEDYEMSIVRGAGKTTGWGIAFTNNAPSAVAGAYAYSVRMYVCQPSHLWAREVELFAGNDVSALSAIDFASSLPSKIMFVVSNIQATRPPRL